MSIAIEGATWSASRRGAVGPAGTRPCRRAVRGDGVSCPHRPARLAANPSSDRRRARGGAGYCGD